MLDKLQAIERRYDELAARLSHPDTISNRAEFEKSAREHKELTELVATFRAFKKATEEFSSSRDLANAAGDAEMRSMAQDEMKLLQGELDGLEERLKLLLLPKNPSDERNVILEIRAGAGGDESSLFAAELFRMYTKYAETRGFKVEIANTSDGSAGGFKEITATISGAGAFSRLKFERGVHRVQRVPETEGSGRVHTSTVTVAVLAEVDDIQIEVKDQDIRTDVFRAGGHGGQSVNTTDSAVRLTHIPTGVVVVMKDEKSQLKNKDKALRILKARLYDREQQAQELALRTERRSQVGTGDRSEKIRTYNFPQSRVTDHRIGLSLHNLADIMNGSLDELVDPLTHAEQAQKMRGDDGPLSGKADDEEDN